MTKPYTPLGPLIVYNEEAEKLRQLWDSRKPSRLGQAQFGEAYDIGGQSAVANFLSGRSALSLKAAIGFARGLNVRIQDFSPRLASEAASIAKALDELNEFRVQPPRSPWEANVNTPPCLGEISLSADGECKVNLQPSLELTANFWAETSLDAYALRVTGDGFYPRFRSGEILVLSEKAPPATGCEALVSVLNDSGMHRYLRIWNDVFDGEVQLLPLSPYSAPISVKMANIESVERVIGCAPRDFLRKNQL